jgi:F0F1-type ATP synthase delta subunit
MKQFNFRDYAFAIYQVARENKSTNKYYDLSKNLILVLNSNKKIINFLFSYNSPIKRKRKLINDLSNGDKLFSNWLNILLDKGRIIYLKDYLLEYIKIYNKENNIEEGII